MMVCSYLVLVLAASLQFSAAYTKYWVSDGCLEKPGTFVNGTLRVMALDTSYGTASVRCCKNDGSSCITPAACFTGKSHAQAAHICAGKGLRLCSLNELAGGICCGTGCDFDYMTGVWTQNKATIRGVLSDMCLPTYPVPTPITPFMPNFTAEPDTSFAYALCVSKPSAQTWASPYSFPNLPQPVPFYAAEKMCKDLPPNNGESFDLADFESLHEQNVCANLPFHNARIWIKDNVLATAYTAMDGCKIRNYGSLARMAGGTDMHYNTFEKHAVRCCSYDGASCTTATRLGCESAVSWWEAHEACHEMGMRLCKKSEIDDDKCCVTGCMFDVDKVWTSTSTFIGRSVKKNTTGTSCNYHEDLDFGNPAQFGVVCCGETSICVDPIPGTCTKKTVKDAIQTCAEAGLEICRDSRLCSRCKNTKCYTEGEKMVAFKTYES